MLSLFAHLPVRFLRNFRNSEMDFQRCLSLPICSLTFLRNFRAASNETSQVHKNKKRPSLFRKFITILHKHEVQILRLPLTVASQASTKSHRIIQSRHHIDASALTRIFSVPKTPLKRYICLSSRKLSVAHMCQKLATSNAELHFRLSQPVRHLKL